MAKLEIYIPDGEAQEAESLKRLLRYKGTSLSEQIRPAFHDLLVEWGVRKAKEPEEGGGE